MTKWRINKVMALWGISFGVVATLTGLFLLEAVEGGFLAESFFLIVLSWILFFVFIARIALWLKRGPKE